MFALFSVSCALGAILCGPTPPDLIVARPGASPVLDGVISDGEYADAFAVGGLSRWGAAFNPVVDEEDLSGEFWVKHDGERLYIAVRVRDDCLYGKDTERWLPDGDDLAGTSDDPFLLERTASCPWFGDMIEVAVFARRGWQDIPVHGQRIPQDAGCWQIVFNLDRSLEHGAGRAGLLPHGPEPRPEVWDRVVGWIESGAMASASRILENPRGYEVEFSFDLRQLFEFETGRGWTPADGPLLVGFNLAVGDFDTRDAGYGNYAGIRHENWWAGKWDENMIKYWGPLILLPGAAPSSE